MAVLDIQYQLGVLAAIEHWLSPPPEERRHYERQGLAVLDHVVKAARRRYPGPRVIGLSLSESEDTPFADIFARHGAEYWPNFTALVRDGSSRPTQCFPWDRHWNHEGNRVAGRLIFDRLRRKTAAAP